MAIKQLTVFVPNRKGAIVEVTDILAKNSINTAQQLSVAIGRKDGFSVVYILKADFRMT